MARLESFLIDEGAVILEECGNPSGIRSVEAHARAEKHLLAIFELVDKCAFPKYSVDEDLARTAMEQGNEREVFEELHAAAVSAVAETAVRLDAHVGPGDGVEADVLRYLMAIHRGSVHNLEAGPQRWAVYEESQVKDLLTLQNTYLGPLVARTQSEASMVVLERYPWQGTACAVPDWDALTARLQAKLGRVEAFVEERSQPTIDGRPNRWEARLNVDLRPNLEFFSEKGWWPGLLSAEVGLEMQIAYWENLTAEAWPTAEEAEYMLAQFRNHTRTPWTEYAVSDFVFLFEDEFSQSIYDWHTHQSLGAAGFMGTMAARWPYADLDCPSAA